MGFMRRALAGLLLTILSLPLIAPAFASAPNDSQLPACCRRGGKHHCAMSMEMAGSPSHFHVASARCPYSPFGHAPFVLPHALAAALIPAGTADFSGCADIVRAAEAGYRISADRARHKRGPPLTLPL